MNTQSINEAMVCRFIATMEQRQSPNELKDFYHPATEQTEFPNAITRNILVRNLDDLMTASVKGKGNAKRRIQHQPDAFVRRYSDCRNNMERDIGNRNWQTATG